MKVNSEKRSRAFFRAHNIIAKRHLPLLSAGREIIYFDVFIRMDIFCRGVMVSNLPNLLWRLRRWQQIYDMSAHSLAALFFLRSRVFALNSKASHVRESRRAQQDPPNPRVCGLIRRSLMRTPSSNQKTTKKSERRPLHVQQPRFVSPPVFCTKLNKHPMFPSLDSGTLSQLGSARTRRSPPPIRRRLLHKLHKNASSSARTETTIVVIRRLYTTSSSRLSSPLLVVYCARQKRRAPMHDPRYIAAQNT